MHQTHVISQESAPAILVPFPEKLDPIPLVLAQECIDAFWNLVLAVENKGTEYRLTRLQLERGLWLRKLWRVEEAGKHVRYGLRDEVTHLFHVRVRVVLRLCIRPRIFELHALRRKDFLLRRGSLRGDCIPTVSVYHSKSRKHNNQTRGQEQMWLWLRICLRSTNPPLARAR